MNLSQILDSQRIGLVTVLDFSFILRGLVMAESLQSHLPQSSVLFICLDLQSRDYIRSLGDARLESVGVDEIGIEDLDFLRQERSRGELAWTITPFALLYGMGLQQFDILIYVDADFFFLASPQQLLREFWDSSSEVLVTEHGYAPEHDGEALFGRFCVQFVAIKANSEQAIIRIWANQCLEWCFAEADGSRFGDQKYLDAWPLQLGSQLKIVRPSSRFVGPWNMSISNPSDAIGFHFHGLRLVAPGQLKIGMAHYQIPQSFLRPVYARYIRALETAERRRSISQTRGLRESYCFRVRRRAIRFFLLTFPKLLASRNRTVPVDLDSL